MQLNIDRHGALAALGSGLIASGLGQNGPANAAVQATLEPANAKSRAGMGVRDVQTVFGEPKMRVPYSVKGRPAEYRIYETASNGSFARFTFIDDVLIEFADGGRFPLDQILSGG